MCWNLASLLLLLLKRQRLPGCCLNFGEEASGEGCFLILPYLVKSRQGCLSDVSLMLLFGECYRSFVKWFQGYKL